MKRENLIYTQMDSKVSFWRRRTAYLYHVAKNHPFIDGNKRTAAALSLTFLELNKVKIKIKMKNFEDLVVGVAEGIVSKQQIAFFLKDQP